MSNEQNFHQQNREVPDKYVSPGVSYQMTTRDYCVRPHAHNAAITITLPPVAEARGRFYSIVCRSASAVNTVTITDKNDSECWPEDVVFNGKCDAALFC